MQQGGRFFARCPENWRDLIGDLAYVFHFPPSELWAMTLDDLEFWMGQADRIGREREAVSGGD